MSYKEPIAIRDVHDLIRRLLLKDEISEDEAHYYLKKALLNKNNHGTWIKKEINKGKFSLSMINVNYEKELFGIGLSGKR